MPSSTSTEHHHDGQLVELSEVDCWERLGEHGVGRLAYVQGPGPVIIPLNYLARDRRIWMRTASYNQLAVHVTGQHAAFQVDHVDEHAHRGWSVLVRGVVEHVLDVRSTAAWPDPVPWPEGLRTMMFCLVPAEVTGRNLAGRGVSPAPGRGPGSVQRERPGPRP